jgi:hypothetical protein
VASRRQRRRRERQLRLPITNAPVGDRQLTPLVYSREQAARLLGISLATLDRRVVPAIVTVKADWGARLIPAGELERFIAERREQPRLRQRSNERSGRRSTLEPETVARILREDRDGMSLGEIARGLNRDAVPTGQGGRQWWPSTVRAVLARARRRASANPGREKPPYGPV